MSAASDWYASYEPVGDGYMHPLADHDMEAAFEAGRALENERIVEIVRTWAEDHKTIQPSFTGLVDEIRIERSKE